jgi:predicted transcriptional regulator YdeE
MVFEREKKECDSITIDDEEFIINVESQNKNGKLGYMASLFQKDEKNVIVEFSKTLGNQHDYFEVTKKCKSDCLDVFKEMTGG